MCGICGTFSFDQRPAEAWAIRAMNARLVHRGPDEDGVYVDGPLGLGARRLSILDLVHGQQPLANEDGRVWAAQNGEIYNFQQLRTELEARGHRFRTRTDTEVLVHGYEAFGDALLQRLEGMFALAIWDAARQRLLLARDRAGMKPLYYAVADGQLRFASEPSALFAVPGLAASLNRAALPAYLCHEYVPSPQTAFQGVQRLEPGHALIAQAGGIHVQRYWEFDLSAS